ncbi:conserved hypothetical protein [uncultured Desulfobacterium sp.]|uniref:Uncharacterized protein n=1 Tax=uncultured Desulfobacterium sp. TaxID=201089 RepID=A0A445MY94_9BACT|nr:conserved hypothetical protein [uncultured Desulfobacterium sp.]
MATRNGNTLSVRPFAGSVLPMNRAQMPAFPAVIFEAVGAASTTRTIRREADAALRITAEVNAPADIQAVIVRPVLRSFDLRGWVVRFPMILSDAAVRIHRPLESRSDTRFMVFAEIERTADSAQLVVREATGQADSRLTVFAVLIREGHTIQT